MCFTCIFLPYKLIMNVVTNNDAYLRFNLRQINTIILIYRIG